MNIEKKENFIKTNEYISIIVCDGGFSPPHTHEFLEMAYVIKGKAVHNFNDLESKIISQGDYFFIDYRTTHGYKSIDGEEFVVINCLFLPELIDKSLVYCKDFKTLLRHYLLRISDEYSGFNIADRIFFDSDKKILNILKEMLFEYEKSNIFKSEFMRLKIMEIMLLTARAVSNEKKTDIVSQVTAEIHKNYNKPITLEGITCGLNYSMPYVSKLFKEKTGLNFKEYLQKVRIEEACRLLVNTNEKVQSVSKLAGYSDSDFFCRIFKKVVGHTPGEFRKNIRKSI